MQANVDAPKVSIYISTFNRIDKLRRAIDSVLRQDYSDWELLICDDASSDGTEEFCIELERLNSNIRYFRNATNLGACVARNLGIFNAKGKFITGLDDDDEFTPERLSFFLENWDDKFSFICCNFTNKYATEESIYYKDNGEKCAFSYKDLLFENEASNQIFTLTSRLQKIGGFNKDVKRLQDWDTWLRLSYEYGGFLRLNKSTYIMNHDHSPRENRVSQNAKITESLLDLASRNHEIYSESDLRYMTYIVDSMNKQARLKETIYWSYKKKNIKFIVKYLLQ
ncbi:glycosyltransferase [Klebsiella michiganensis]